MLKPNNLFSCFPMSFKRIKSPTVDSPENIFKNDVVQSQLDSDAVESMVQGAVTNVLVIYTGAAC